MVRAVKATVTETAGTAEARAAATMRMIMSVFRMRLRTVKI